MLTIHLGMPKTGSTAIQNALRTMSSAELLGIRYRGRNSWAENDGFYGRSLSFEVPEGANHTPTVRLLRRGHHVVLSEEGFLGHPYVPNVASIASHASTASSAIIDFFHNKGPFQIVIYFRAQHQWLEALYNQYLKSRSGIYGIDSTEFAERAIESPFFYWTELVDELKKQVGSEHVVVRAYRPGENVVEDFLKVLNVPIPQRFLSPKFENSSLPIEQLAIRKRLNELCFEAGKLHLAPSVARLVGESFASARRKNSLFTEEIQAKLISITATDWKNLSAAVADTLLPEPHHFKSVAIDAQHGRLKEYAGRIDDVPTDHKEIQQLFDSLQGARFGVSSALARAIASTQGILRAATVSSRRHLRSR